MTTEEEGDFQLEIGHVLFIDVVGYSKLLIDEQRQRQSALNEVVRGTEQFRISDAAGKLVRLPTGDGMALVFRDHMEAPARCAVQISEALRKHPEIQVRMGIHSGPVSDVRDVNEHSNIAGDGVNLAQRVMSCGDGGHILLSKRMADDLAQHTRWRPQLHELGQIEVKHGVKIDIVNLYSDGIGNAAVPGKIAEKRRALALADEALQKRSRIKRRSIATAVITFAALAVGLSIFAYRTLRLKNSASLPADKSVAVLPFENLSDEKENAFFADGIQDDVLTSLAKIGELKVISRTSVSQYRGAGGARNLREIARALGVQNVLEGSVRRVANRVLVNVQLIDARNDRHIWAERYDRTISDSIGLQGELAAEIAGALRAKLAQAEKASLETKPTNNADAYVLYLRARERERGVFATQEDLAAGEQLYTQAIALDPSFALARARLSMNNTTSYFYYGPDPARKSKARTEAEEALRLAPDLAEGHVALGFHLFSSEKNYPAALKELAVAEKATPNNPEVLRWTAIIYRRQGRWREAIDKFHRAATLDPRNAETVLSAAVTDFFVRDWPAASAGFRRLRELEPEAVGSLAYVEIVRTGDVAVGEAILRESPKPKYRAGWDLSMLKRDFAAAEGLAEKIEEAQEKTWLQAFTAIARGDAELARKRFDTLRVMKEKQMREYPDEAQYPNALGVIYSFLGRKADAIRESRRAVEMERQNRDTFHATQAEANLALVYAWTGEADLAVESIARLLVTPGAVDTADSTSITLTDLRLRWEWDPLRSNARFQKILAAPEPKTIY
jgi:TolB-like protein